MLDVEALIVSRSAPPRSDKDNVGERYVLAAGAVGDHTADINTLR